MNKEIIFIGTGSGKTSLNRFHSSILIKTDNSKAILIDAGDSISRALLFNKIDFNIIDTIIISHFHADHYAGLASLLTQMHISKRENPLTIIVYKDFEEQIISYLNQSYLFKETLTFPLELEKYDFENNTILTKNISFIAKQNSHVSNKHNLNGYKNIKFISSSFLFDIEGIKIFYTADIGSDEDLLLFNLDKVDILISEITHIEKKSIAEILEKFPHLKIYLTHINEEDIEELIKWKSELGFSYKERVIIASDGLKIVL